MKSSRTIRCSASRAPDEPIKFLAKVKLRGFELRCVETRPPYGVGRQRCPWATPEEKIILLERQTVCAGADKSEHCREFKEMNFHFAHQSSNPTTPATQLVWPMCREMTRRSQRRAATHLFPAGATSVVLIWTYGFRRMAERQGLGVLMSIGKSRAKVYVETDTEYRR